MLYCHSFYSLHYGLASPEAIIEWAVAEGEQRLLLADINTTAAVLETMRLGQEAGVEVLPGLDIRNDLEPLYLLLPRNDAGFAAANRWLSHHLQEKRNFPSEATIEHCWTIYPWKNAPQRPLAEQEKVGVAPEDLSRFRLRPAPFGRENALPWYANTFRHQRDFNAHRLLRAVGDNALLSQLPSHRQAPRRLGWHTSQSLAALYPEPQNWEQSAHRILEACQLSFEFKNYHRSQNQSCYTSSPAEDQALIRRLCEEGLEYRYPPANRRGPLAPEVRTRMEYELDIIGQRGYFSYFLINWDIVSYARRQNYFYIGRGSGANSLVAYLLRITDVDPLELDLYFERFINLSRQQPPDFDIDFSWRDRPDITRYIFERFPRAALLGSYTTFKYRALARELGKVLGLPAADIEAISHPQSRPEDLDELQQLVLRYGKLIEGFPHRRSVHASGILIPQREIYHFGATFLPPKGFPTTHFDMYAAEDVGLYKFDILGQRGLAKIKDALDLVRQRYPDQRNLDIHQVAPFLQDPAVKRLLRQGHTMACFYVESPAMRALLRKLQADNFRALVAASSIIRPGVSSSGMMAEYIRRYREPQRRQYIHPRIQEILSETYGVMVYQEDVLKVAHDFAGLSLEEADVLRRGMSWKFRERSQFHSIQDKFFANCHQRGYPESVTREVWRQIESFANYAFAKGHSASYAVESYQSLYLKAHYPLEYLTATVNNGGGFYSLETYLNEARLHGAQVEPPCINNSSWQTVLLHPRMILGFQHLRDLEENTGTAILRARDQDGPFQSLSDFLQRVSISLEQLLLLIRIRAFRSLEPDAKKLLWEAHFRLGQQQSSQPLPELFRSADAPAPTMPELEHAPHEQALEEMELLGFPLSSPFDLLLQPSSGTILARELPSHIGSTVSLLGYLIHVKNVTTRGARSQHMQFGTFLDREGHFIDTVHFPPIAARYPFQGRGIYWLQGRVIEEYDFVSLETLQMKRLPYQDME